MNKLTKKIEFISAFDFVDHVDINPPQTISKFVPKWYKDLNTFINNTDMVVMENGDSNLTAKACMPLLDSMTTGYAITLPCDIKFVNLEKFGYRVSWEMPWQIITSHSKEQTANIGLGDIYEENAYKFEGLWRIKTPPGYSLLYTHPFYNFNLPFLTATGIVDSDVFDKQINIPFFIKRGFEGTIEKDTPIAQIIPIKREKWQSSVKQYDQSYKHHFMNLKLKNFRSYKQRWWHRKEYQ